MMFQAGPGAANVGAGDQYPKAPTPKPNKPSQGPMVVPETGLSPEDGWE
jgi:hypothetical protein